MLLQAPCDFDCESSARDDTYSCMYARAFMERSQPGLGCSAWQAELVWVVSVTESRPLVISDMFTSENEAAFLICVCSVCYTSVNCNNSTASGSG